jgi:hypothetical protein
LCDHFFGGQPSFLNLLKIPVIEWFVSQWDISFPSKGAVLFLAMAIFLPSSVTRSGPVARGYL